MYGARRRTAVPLMAAACCPTSSADKGAKPSICRSGLGARTHRAQRACDLDEFDDVEAPLTAFDFSDEGMRSLQANRQFSLRQPCVLTRLCYPAA